MEYVEKETWQLLALQDIEREQKPHLRISSSGHCSLALMYAAAGFEETDPPDQDSLNRMALGHLAEILIIRALKAQGWETAHTVIDGGQMELILPIKIDGFPYPVIGHPDGICRHPEWTKGLWVTLECKSMSVDRGLDVERRGVIDVYPAYQAQAALYGHRLYDMGLVAHPGRAVFGMMDREGRIVGPERVSWGSDYVDDLLGKLEDVIRTAIINKELIAPPFFPESEECKLCNYFSKCWGFPRPPGKNGRPEIIQSDDPELVGAGKAWSYFKPALDENRDLLRLASDRAGGATIQTGGVLAGYFWPRESPAYDPKALEERIPLDILRSCLSSEQPIERPGFWIRKERRG